MKKWIKATTNTNRLPITELTEDEISVLPDQVTVVTRRPGPSSYIPEFRIVTKDRLETPDKCILIDSYWGYAHGRDVYLATKGEVAEYFDRQIKRIEHDKRKLSRYAL